MKVSEFKEHIDVMMVAAPESSMACLVKMRCAYCLRNCDVNFCTHSKLSFASVAQLVGVFCMLCGKLEKVDIKIAVHVGPPQAMLLADDVNNQGA